MSHDGLTLLDVLTMAPSLLPTCLSIFASTSKGIRALRLVSKGMGHIALTAVTSCEVYLGEEASPNPQQIVKLMSQAQLHTFSVIIIACEGGCAFLCPSVIRVH